MKLLDSWRQRKVDALSKQIDEHSRTIEFTQRIGAQLRLDPLRVDELNAQLEEKRRNLAFKRSDLLLKLHPELKERREL